MTRSWLQPWWWSPSWVCGCGCVGCRAVESCPLSMVHGGHFCSSVRAPGWPQPFPPLVLLDRVAVGQAFGRLEGSHGQGFNPRYN